MIDANIPPKYLYISHTWSPFASLVNGYGEKNESHVITFNNCIKNVIANRREVVRAKKINAFYLWFRNFNWGGEMRCCGDGSIAG